MNFEFKNILQNELIRLEPLKEEDFEKLFKIASDPLIWQQHPNKDRYKKDVFQNFFEEGIKSASAFIIYDQQTNIPIGSSRYYDFNEQNKSVVIGYTFLARKYWGGKYNKALKGLMLNHAFNFVNTVIFHIGSTNIRSQRAIEKIGAKKVGEIEVDYPGEVNKLNFIYEITNGEY